MHAIIAKLDKNVVLLLINYITGQLMQIIQHVTDVKYCTLKLFVESLQFARSKKGLFLQCQISSTYSLQTISAGVRLYLYNVDCFQYISLVIHFPFKWLRQEAKIKKTAAKQIDIHCNKKPRVFADEPPSANKTFFGALSQRLWTDWLVFIAY